MKKDEERSTNLVVLDQLRVEGVHECTQRKTYKLFYILYFYIIILFYFYFFILNLNRKKDRE